MENEPNHRREFVKAGAVVMPVLCMCEFIAIKLVQRPELIVPTLLVVAAGGSFAAMLGLSIAKRYLK